MPFRTFIQMNYWAFL